MQSIASRQDDDLGIRPMPHVTPATVLHHKGITSRNDKCEKCFYLSQL
ncbi:MAG: hypothetical protein AAFQ14_07080 [Cyanobacteria bacterium J06621_12]